MNVGCSVCKGSGRMLKQSQTYPDCGSGHGYTFDDVCSLCNGDGVIPLLKWILFHLCPKLCLECWGKGYCTESGRTRTTWAGLTRFHTIYRCYRCNGLGTRLIRGKRGQ
jgi:hypothetical protein